MSQSWYQLDWIWQVAGWTLAALGVLPLIWSLFSDRSRGRRRCPKCWYDMKGIPGLRCPECGRESRSERQLDKTRRKWRLAFGSLLLLLLAYVSCNWLEYSRGGWVRMVPTAVLVMASDGLTLTDLTPSTTPGTTQMTWVPGMGLPLVGGAFATAKPLSLSTELERRYAEAAEGTLTHWLLAWRATRGDKQRPLPTIGPASREWEATYGSWLARRITRASGHTLAADALKRLLPCCYAIRRDTQTGVCSLVCISETAAKSLTDLKAPWINIYFRCDTLDSPTEVMEEERGMSRLERGVPQIIGPLGVLRSARSSLPVRARFIERIWKQGEVVDSDLFEINVELRVE